MDLILWKREPNTTRIDLLTFAVLKLSNVGPAPTHIHDTVEQAPASHSSPILLDRGDGADVETLLKD